LGQVGAYLAPAGLETSLRRLARRELWPAWLRAEWFLARGVRPAPGQRDAASLHECLHLARTRTNLPMLLRFDDRSSMACSVESRVPFLTRPLAEFLAGLPADYLLDGEARSKSIFRQAMRGIVPDAVLDRPDKVGFATPERSWLVEELAPWVEDLLSRGAVERIPALEPAALAEEWRAVRSGRRRFDYRVWRWINLIRWVELNGARFA